MENPVDAKYPAQIGLAILLAGVAAIAHAGEWRITPRLSIDQTVTDNVTQSDIGQTGDFITGVSPGLSLRGTGARITSNVDYSFRRSFFARNPQFDDGRHSLQGTTEIELVKNRLFVNTNSTRSQQLTDTTGRISRNRNSRNGNRSDVTRFQVAPRLQERLGDWANLDFTYSYDEANFSDDSNQNSGGAIQTSFGNQNDSTENDIQLTISTGNKFSRTPMTLALSDRTTEREGNPKETFKRINGNVGLVLNRKFTVNFSAGTEKNSFRTTRNQNDGFSWSFGGTWTPSRRTTISGRYGRRFFGNNYNVEVSHTHRRWNFSLNYDESLRTGNDIQRDVVLVPLQDSFGNPIFDPVASTFVTVPLDTPSIRNESSVSKKLRMRTAYRMRRSQISFAYSEVRENFEASAVEEKLRLADIKYTRTISSRLSAALDFTWRRGRSRNSNGGDLLNFSAALNYTLGPHTSTRLNYTFADQGAGGNGRTSYTEHSMVAGLVFHF